MIAQTWALNVKLLLIWLRVASSKTVLRDDWLPGIALYGNPINYLLNSCNCLRLSRLLLSYTSSCWISCSTFLESLSCCCCFSRSVVWFFLRDASCFVFSFNCLCIQKTRKMLQNCSYNIEIETMEDHKLQSNYRNFMTISRYFRLLIFSNILTISN